MLIISYIFYWFKRNTNYSWCGLNGITYASNGYLLALQTNTGKVFKVDATDGTARLVLLPKALPGADGIAIRKDGTAVVVSQARSWQLKSSNAWAEGVVYDEVKLDEERAPTGVVVREGERAYVLYGSANEGKEGRDREEFSIEEIEWEEREGDAVWAFILLGLGLCYFLYWRFQMGQLVKNMNKKRAWQFHLPPGRKQGFALWW